MKYPGGDYENYNYRSPSMRREWIEIVGLCCALSASGSPSPSMRREWIEILQVVRRLTPRRLSPSMRREWIEIMFLANQYYANGRSPSMRREWIEICVVR